jgi:phage portal protein BeeE
MRAFRLVNVIEEPESFDAGADYASGIPTAPRYDPRRAMSALPANPWLAAAVTARAEDLAGVPLRVSLNGEDLEGETADEVLALFPRLLRMQAVADRDLEGNAYLLPLRGFGAPVEVKRLHPARVDLIPAEDGSVAGYEYRGSGESVRTYLPSDVQHVRGISWADDPTGLFGIGAIQSLDADLVADRNLAQASARSASKGRPDAIYRPSSDKVVWNQRQTAEIKRNLEQVMSRNEGGVAVLSGMGTLEVLGWSPREMQGVEQRTWTRETILARLGVPGTRVGLPDANYATALAQLTIYWTNLRATAALLDDAFTAIAQMHTEGLVIRHDFTQVPALQASRSAALDRVGLHVQNGVPPAAAYRLEGFEGVATALDGPEVEEEPSAAPEAPQDAPRGLAEVGTLALDDAVAELASALAVLTDEDSTAEDRADALLSIDAAREALEVEQSSRLRMIG